MEDSLFQTFLLLAYFDIALITIAIANYAVSASYLGRETRTSRQRMERKKQELVKTLRDLQKEECQIHEIKRKIKESDAERKRLNLRIFLLSWMGAVILPSMFFIISFALAVVGLNSEIFSDTSQFLQQQSMIFSLGTISIGFMILLFIIRTIDSAARNIPLPKFEANFVTGLKKEKCKSKEKKEITFCIKNEGEAVAEKTHIFINFPPEFGVHKKIAYYSVFEQGIETEHAGYIAAIFRIETIHVDTSMYLKILLTMPEKEDVYKIPIHIYERKIGIQKDKLIIEIIG